jgi:AraC-like DNA-binding protein
MKDQLDTAARALLDQHHPLRQAEITAALVSFLLEVIKAAGKLELPDADERIERVLTHIRQRIEEPLPVPELAALAGLSTSRFKALFKQHTGVPSGEYVMQQRVEEARRRLIHDDESITRIAMDLGFSSSQYFATVFKRHAGCPPTALRKIPES